MPGGGRLNILVLFAVGMDEREGRINMAADLQAAGLLQLAFHADEISRPVHECYEHRAFGKILINIL